MRKISAIITAAGKSSRMTNDQEKNSYPRKNKLVLPIKYENIENKSNEINKNNGEYETIIERTIKNTLNSKIDQCIVVLGHDSDIIYERISHIDDNRLKIIYNNPIDVSLSSSLLNGIENSKNDIVLCIAGDQPTVTTKTYNNLIDSYLSDTDENKDISEVNTKKRISILRRREIGILKSAEGLGMPFIVNSYEIIPYLKDFDDNLNPLLRKLFSDGFIFNGIAEENELELLNINKLNDYNIFINNE